MRLVIKRKISRSKVAGFTLIELLIVLFIIALLSTAIVFNVTPVGKRKTPRTLAEKLHKIFPLAREYAALHAVVLKFSIEEDAYAFYQLVEKNGVETWQLLNKPDFLKSEKISDYAAITLKAHTSLDSEKDISGISIEIFPTMEIEPFILNVGTKAVPEQYSLTLGRNGVLSLNQTN